MSTTEGDEDRDWHELTMAEFLKGYADSDSVYDEYFSCPHEDPTRQVQSD